MERIKNEESLYDLWDYIKRTNNGLIRFPKGEKREKGAENLFEEIAENFPNQAHEESISSC